MFSPFLKETASEKSAAAKEDGRGVRGSSALAHVANRGCRQLRRRPLRCCGALRGPTPRSPPPHSLCPPPRCLSPPPRSFSLLRPALSPRERAEPPRAGGRRGAGAGLRPSHQPAPASCSRSIDTFAAEGAARRCLSPFSAGVFMSRSRIFPPCPPPGQQAFEGGPGRPESNLGYCHQQHPNPPNCPSLPRVHWQRLQSVCRVQAPSDIGGTPLRQDGKVWRWFEKGDEDGRRHVASKRSTDLSS